MSLTDGSILFHRRVALEWKVPRPEFILYFGVIRSFLFEVLMLQSLQLLTWVFAVSVKEQIFYALRGSVALRLQLLYCTALVSTIKPDKPPCFQFSSVFPEIFILIKNTKACLILISNQRDSLQYCSFTWIKNENK